MILLTVIIAAAQLLFWTVFITNLVYLRTTARRASGGPTPRLSVLVPARNEERNVGRLLDALRAQTYPDAEFIVYDDGSTDKTGEIVADYAAADARIVALRGSGPAPGWVGKVHALYQATRRATGDVYLFLDADADLLHPDALAHLVARYQALPPGGVLTGLTNLRFSGGRLLVSLVPHVILTGLPWMLARRFDRIRALGALNGQCWMMAADQYRALEPHDAVRAEVLEDVEIGRYLRGKGIKTCLVDVQREVAIHMYRDLADAWQGFRKNAYLILGGTPLAFAVLWPFYVLVTVVSPLVSPWFLVSIYGLKLATDRVSGFPLWLTALAPVSFALGAFNQLDSAWAHFRRRVEWKGRRV